MPLNSISILALRESHIRCITTAVQDFVNAHYKLARQTADGNGFQGRWGA